jgi:hypothetical protein
MSVASFSSQSIFVRKNMNIQKLAPIGILLLGSVTALSAQNPLSDPYDEGCWQSLSALHACELERYNRAMDQAEQCTSYPEYQCMPVTEQNAAGRIITKRESKPVNQTAGTSEQATPEQVPPSRFRSEL